MAKSKIPYLDKMYHFFGAYFIMTILYLINIWLGVVTITLLAAGKEVYDYKKGGSVEMLDVVCTALGGAVGFVVMLFAGGKL